MPILQSVHVRTSSYLLFLGGQCFKLLLGYQVFYPDQSGVRFIAVINDALMEIVPKMCAIVMRSHRTSWIIGVEVKTAEVLVYLVDRREAAYEQRYVCRPHLMIPAPAAAYAVLWYTLCSF